MEDMSDRPSTINSWVDERKPVLSKDTDLDAKRCHYKSIKAGFICMNTLFWLFVMAVTWILISCIVANQSLFTSGRAVIAYGFLAFALVGITLCFVGFVGISKLDSKLFVGYILLFTILLILQISLIVSAYTLYGEPILMIEQAWNEATDQLKEFASGNLMCCGFSQTNDTYSSSEAVPEACKSVDGVLYTNGCGQAILLYLSGSGSAYFLAILVSVATVEIVTFCLGCAVYHYVEEIALSQTPWFPQHNKITPVLESPFEPKSVIPSKTPHDTVTDTVTLSPTPSSEKGNEQLFSVVEWLLKK